MLPYSWYTPWWRLVESVSTAVTSISLLYHLIYLTKLWMTTSTLHLTPEHFQTLGLSNRMYRFWIYVFNTFLNVCSLTGVINVDIVFLFFQILCTIHIF